MLEGLPMSFVTLVINALGWSGIAVVFWYVDNRRMERKDAEYKKEMAQKDAEHKKEIAIMLEQISLDRHTHERGMREMLDAYREDVRKVARFYEDNVTLVKGYDRLCDDLIDTVRLNTATQQGLLDWLKNRVPCYQLKKEVGG